MSIDIELFGGLADGRLDAIQCEYLYRPLYVRVAWVPSVAEILTNHHHGVPTISPEPLRYEWDGTVREDGVRRFRLRG